MDGLAGHRVFQVLQAEDLGISLTSDSQILWWAFSESSGMNSLMDPGLRFLKSLNMYDKNT